MISRYITKLGMPLILVGMLLTTIGCSGGGLHPIQGTVHFPNGKPLKTGRVILEGGSPELGSWGIIHPDGSFVLGTYDIDDGVPAGKYRVYIQNAETLPPPNLGDRVFVPRPLIHPKYTTAAQSGLEFEVPGETTQWEIVVDPPPKS